jgi:hypothetical protein
MDSRIIHKTSEKLRLNINWIKPSDTEWIYCGAKDEVRFDVVEAELIPFLDGNIFYVATTRNNSFEIKKQDLLSSISNIVGSKNFFIWNEGFKKVIEFNHIGVLRKGIFNANVHSPVFKINYNKIVRGSPDKVGRYSVRYHKGDCFSIECGNGKYLAAFISEKFNKFYDFTLIEYLKDTKPIMNHFFSGRFFGKYFMATNEEVYPGTERHMLPCLDVDTNASIEKIGSLELIEPLEKASYGYLKSVDELFQHYVEALPVIKQRTRNSKQPSRIFSTGDILIEIKQILKVDSHT